LSQEKKSGKFWLIAPGCPLLFILLLILILILILILFLILLLILILFRFLLRSADCESPQLAFFGYDKRVTRERLSWQKQQSDPSVGKGR